MRCAVSWCKYNKNNRKQISHSFKFPKNASLLKKWISYCRRKDLLDVKNERICGDHFNDDDIKNNLQFSMGLAKVKLLKKGAFPSEPKGKKQPNHRQTRMQEKQRKLLVSSISEEHDHLQECSIAQDMREDNYLEDPLSIQLKVENIPQNNHKVMDDQMKSVDLQIMDKKINEIIKMDSDMGHTQFLLESQINKQCLPEDKEMFQNLSPISIVEQEIIASKPTRKIHKYTEEAMATALLAIRSGMGINKASREYGVPRGTIHDRLKGRVPEGPRKMGPNPYLSHAEEDKIVEWCNNMVKCGFPWKECEILNTAQKMIADDNRKTPFKNGRPGRRWFESFLKRNPHLKERPAESIKKSGAVITEQYIRKWFTDLENYLISINSLDVMNDPNRILNGDEANFVLCPNTGKVLAPRVFKNKMSSEEQTLTVLMVFSANGQTFPPLVVFPYKRTQQIFVNSMPEHWFWGKSDSGWMGSDIFYDYIVNVVDKWLREKNIVKPVIIFLDGHKAHLSLKLSEYCFNNKIILYALPPNTTHMMQPANVSVFRPLKQEWKKTAKEWLSLNENSNTMITKSNFCSVFKMVLEKPDMVDKIKDGFKRCGLYPFVSNAVDYTKFKPKFCENLPTVSTTISQSEINTTLSVINRLKEKLENKGINVEELISDIS